MKHKLIILSNWTTPIEKTWSGTTYSLTKALSLYYDVEIKDLSIGKFLKTLEKLSHIQSLGIVFGMMYDSFLRIKANYILRKNKDIPVFEICQDIKIKNPYFTYQDMSYKVGLDIKRLKEKYDYIYPAAGINVYSKNEIERRIHRQYKEYSQAKAVFFMSYWVKDLMSQHYPELADKIVHIGGGSNIDETKIDYSKKEGNKFLFIGRDFNRKAGDLVIEAFKILKSQAMPNAELHMAGCKPMETYKDIYYHGDVNYDKISELLNMCDVFCMPSRFEAYGLVFIESLMYGLPCIGRDFFEMPYFIKRGCEGELIKDDNPETLAKKMATVIADKKMINQVQSNRALYLSKYSWESVAKRAKIKIDSTLGWI